MVKNILRVVKPLILLFYLPQDFCKDFICILYILLTVPTTLGYYYHAFNAILTENLWKGIWGVWKPTIFGDPHSDIPLQLTSPTSEGS